MEYRPHGVCSRLIHLDVEDDIIKNVQFVGGCSGNTHGRHRLRRQRHILPGSACKSPESSNTALNTDNINIASVTGKGYRAGEPCILS